MSSSGQRSMSPVVESEVSLSSVAIRTKGSYVQSMGANSWKSVTNQNTESVPMLIKGLQDEVCARLDRIEQHVLGHAVPGKSHEHLGHAQQGLHGHGPHSPRRHLGAFDPAPETASSAQRPATDEDNVQSPLPSEMSMGIILRQEWREICRKQAAIFTAEGVRSKIMGAQNSRSRVVEEDGRLPWWLVQPSGRFRLVWDIIMIAFVTHDMAVVPVTMAFNAGQNYVTEVLFWPCLLFWTFDMPLSFVTGFYRQGRLESRLWRILLSYLRTWFLLDAFMLATMWIEVAVTDTSRGFLLGRAGKTVRILRITRSLRILRLAKLRRITDNIQDHIKSRYHNILISVAKLILTVCWLNHFIACSWWGLGVNLRDVGPDGSWTSFYGFESRSLGFQYFTSLHWSLTQFTPAGMEVSAKNLPERIFSVIVLLFAMVAFSSFVSSITAAMTKLREFSTTYDSHMSTLRRYLQARNISMDLTNRILSCVEYRCAKEQREIQETQVEFLRFLSKPLHKELATSLYAPTLVMHPFLERFEQVDSEAMRHVCLEAVEDVTLASGDLLFTDGCRCEQVFFVQAGRMRYHSKSSDGTIHARNWAAHDDILEAGEWCCEIALWCPWTHVGTMSTRAMTEVLAVDILAFMRVTSAFDSVQGFSGRYAELFTEETSLLLQEGTVSDLTYIPIDTLEAITERAYIGVESPKAKRVRRGSRAGQVVRLGQNSCELGGALVGTPSQRGPTTPQELYSDSKMSAIRERCGEVCQLASVQEGCEDGSDPVAQEDGLSGGPPSMPECSRERRGPATSERGGASCGRTRPRECSGDVGPAPATPQSGGGRCPGSAPATPGEGGGGGDEQWV